MIVFYNAVAVNDSKRLLIKKNNKKKKEKCLDWTLEKKFRFL